MCGCVENVKGVKVEAEVVAVVEAMHQTINYHSISARSSYTWSSSSALWIPFAASIAPYPSHVVHTAPYTSCRLLRAAFALIHLARAPDHGYVHICPKAQLQTQRLENMTYCL